MNSSKKPLVVCTTLLIETSPQSLPLGAACVASAIKWHPLTKDLFDVKLVSVSMEDCVDEVCGIGKATYDAGTATQGTGSSTSRIDDAPFDKLRDRTEIGEATQNSFYLSEICKYGEPDFALFSVYVWNRRELEKTAKEIKKRFPKCVTIAGGPEVTANPKSFTAFDYTVSGAGEISVPILLNRIACESETCEATSETCEATRGTESATRGIGTTDYPSPYLDGTLDPTEYGGALWELARGCPFKCSYCFESKGENRIEYFPIERIQKELDLFAQKKIPQVFVLDPTYNADKKRAVEILSLIEKKTPNTFYYFEARAEFIDRELARAFTKIPCALQFGLQSADESVLKLVHRSFNKKQFTKNISILNQEGVIFGFDLIYGLPGDTLKGFESSVDFAIRLYPNNLETFCLSVLPGTVLFDEAKSLNLKFESEPPYHVTCTDKFSKSDLQSARELSMACNVFYNDGRAVPWFNSLADFFHLQGHKLLRDFWNWLKNGNSNLKESDWVKISQGGCLDFKKIQKLQLDYAKFKCTQKNLNWAYKAIESIILLNGAYSEKSATGKSQTVQLNYSPADLESEFASDIAYFARNARPRKCTVKV